jgi:hypothetical protein
MKSLRTLSIALCLVAACAFLMPTAVADEWNHRTYVTFSAPVEVPGVGAQVLPAGTYMFKLMDSTSNRNIVQIFNERGTHVYTTILAIPNYRPHVTDNTVITFWERAEGQPQAIRAWFYPGEFWGQEFIYPKAAQVAVNTEPILAPQEPVAEAAPTPVETPAPVEEVAQATPPPEQQPAPAVVPEQQPEAAALPQTASYLPLFALTGLLSLGTGCALWMFSRRSANQRRSYTRVN